MDTSTQTGTERNVQDEIKESVHRIWLAGLGALAVAEEEGGKVFSRLVERGRDVESKGKVEVDKMRSDAERFNERFKAKAESAFETWGDRFDEKLTATLRRLGVPTREEIRNLTQKVEELNAKIELLKPRVTPAGPTVVTPAGTPPAGTGDVIA